jgi:hypothetical protein
MNKKGYFADSILEFEDLKNCSYGEYREYREHDKCFGYSVVGNLVDFYKAYFIPEDVLKPEEPEKKYRPFSIKDWKLKHSIGETVLYRSKVIDHGERYEAEVMYLGYIKPLDGITDEVGAGELVLGKNSHSLQYLFDNYEIWVDGGWKPFGIEE